MRKEMKEVIKVAFLHSFNIHIYFFQTDNKHAMRFFVILHESETRPKLESHF